MAENNEYKGKIAFFFRNSWYHRTKTLLDDGTTKYGRIGGFNTPEEAEESYKKNIEEYEKQRIDFYAPLNNKEVLLKDYIVYWYEKIFKYRAESTTLMVASYTIYNLIIPNLPYDIKLRLTTTDYINEVLERTDKIGKTTANKSREVLKMIFNDAVSNMIITTNPVEKSKIYAREKPNITILTKDEIKTLLKESVKSNWYLEILLAIFCGLRKGEILGLKFEDFNKENKTLTISRQLTKKYELNGNEFKVKKTNYVERNPKTDNGNRILKVPAIIFDELERRRKNIDDNIQIYGDSYKNNGYISCTCDGKPHSSSALNGYISKLCTKNNIPQITVHGLRHMYAIILIEQGVKLEKISALLGHSSIHTTFDIYLDVMEEKDKILSYINNTFAVSES